MSFRSLYVHARVRKPGRIISASLLPNFRADSSRMSFSVSTLPPSARERLQRLASPLPYRWIVREQDRLDVELGEPRDRLAGEGHVVGEQVARKSHPAAYALQ